MIKIGDNVRFLNAVGGGKVTRIDEKKGLVYVEDEDGFEVPALERECVVIQAVNEKTNFPVKEFTSKPTQAQSNIPEAKKVIEVEKKEIPIVETAEGETLKALLAFFPADIKQLQTTSYECYLVNDSNYFLYYNFVIGEKNVRKSIANGIIEPNLQEFLAEIKKEELNNWENLRVQILPFKKEKTYTEQSVIDFILKLNTVKFYKLHSFTETEYFDDLCMLIDITKAKQEKQLSEINPEKIKEAIFEKREEKRPRIELKKPKQSEVIEVDLHINQLIDNIAGLSNADMLQYQMEVFHKTLEENKNKRGQKIVFIHGKGEGVLRKEIEKELKSRYKNYYFQDASFREYGFGATMVTIR
ncbi:conserved hypothetical protein [uncultured Paludibacter sp.]|uniref:Smr domain-containing protein n=1 Tax=uncultured Paludibacter sp. TaxID=497635 RepID=A0A653AGZ8_9BACT|nr:conserved hypothetical protein [uncultured Paludibacter sp.]